MGNRRNRRSRRLETPSPERSTDRTQVETPNTGNITLTNPDTVVQEGLGEGNSREQLVEPSQVSNEIQAWTKIFEQKNNDRITKTREEMENKLDAILMEIKTSKSTSLTTNPRSEMNEIESMQPSGSKGKKSMVVNASDNESIDSENEDIPLKASEMRDLKHPAKPIHQNDTTLDATVIFNEESDEEDYHSSKRKSHLSVRLTNDIFAIFQVETYTEIPTKLLQTLQKTLTRNKKKIRAFSKVRANSV